MMKKQYVNLFAILLTISGILTSCDNKKNQNNGALDSTASP